MATLHPDLNASKTDAFLLAPENLTLVTDPASPLYDPRVHDAPDEALIRNIMVNGVLEPVLIRKNGNLAEVIDGRCRVKAALEANARLTAEGKQAIRVPAILKRGPDADLFGVLISTNECRRDDTPLAKADKAQRLINMGKTVEEVAVAFGVTRQAVESWLSLQDVAAPVREAVEAGELSASAAVQLSNLDREEQAQALQNMKAEGGKVTVARAKKAARAGDCANTPKMRPRKAVESCLYDKTSLLHAAAEESRQEYARGFCAALRWTLGLEELPMSEDETGGTDSAEAE